MTRSQIFDDLKRWGPDASWVSGPTSLEESQLYCRKLATSHYENFPVASFLIPKRLQPHFFNVYAFCRWADDLADEADSIQDSLRLLRWWQAELEDCFAGRVWHPVFVALRSTIQEFQLKIEPFSALISAFMQDQTLRDYETFAQLLDYCQRSANPVGCIVLSLFSKATPDRLEWSNSICTGLQLANFWQDIARDLDKGRIYLPREDREKYGVTLENLRSKKSTTQFTELMKFQIERAREYFLAGDALPRSLGGRLGAEIALIRSGGLLILESIQKQNYQVLERRPVLSKKRLLLEAFKTLPVLLTRPT